jgi:hypothetical protein
MADGADARVTADSDDGREPADSDDGREPAGRRTTRRRTDRVVDLLPPATSDESARGWGDVDDVDPDDRLRREVPPHHGD